MIDPKPTAFVAFMFCDLCALATAILLVDSFHVQSGGFVFVPSRVVFLGCLLVGFIFTAATLLGVL